MFSIKFTIATNLISGVFVFVFKNNVFTCIFELIST